MSEHHKLLAVLAAVSFVVATPALAQNPMVGGAPMMADKNIMQNASNSKDHTTLVAAVKAAGLVRRAANRRNIPHRQEGTRDQNKLAIAAAWQFGPRC
jgi:uncharacterized surface protein with fasciclin (FAS1) repeats